MINPLDRQIGGSHYKKYKIQPAEYMHANNIPFLEGEAISYITRWRDKDGLSSIRKAIHILEILIQLEEAKEKNEQKPVSALKGAERINREYPRSWEDLFKQATRFDANQAGLASNNS